jgi:hypothetical protein
MGEFLDPVSADGKPELLKVLKKIVEGDDLPIAWHLWLEANEGLLTVWLTRSANLRLKKNPLIESQEILRLCGILFEHSDRYEWLASDSKSGRCRYCGQPIQRSKGGSACCPRGCFTLRT